MGANSLPPGQDFDGLIPGRGADQHPGDAGIGGDGGGDPARVDTKDTALGGNASATVYVLVTQAQVGPLVDALGNDAKVTLVLNTAGSGS